jgi:multidrug resistance efflux pump
MTDEQHNPEIARRLASAEAALDQLQARADKADAGIEQAYSHMAAVDRHTMICLASLAVVAWLLRRHLEEASNGSPQ